MSHSIAARNAILDARNALANGGTVEYRTGSSAPVDSAPAGTVLVTFNMQANAFSAAASAQALVNTIDAQNATAANGGGACHYVVKDSSGNVIWNGESGGALTISPLTWSIGDPVTITSWLTSQPA